MTATYKVLGIVAIVGVAAYVAGSIHAQPDYPNQTPVEKALGRPQTAALEPASQPDTPIARAARLASQINTMWLGKDSCSVSNPLPALEKNAALHPEWSDHNLAGVACKTAFVGMTTQMIRAEGVEPQHITRSGDATTEREQWVIGAGVLNFEGPIGGELKMTSWQVTR